MKAQRFAKNAVFSVVVGMALQARPSSLLAQDCNGIEMPEACEIRDVPMQIAELIALDPKTNDYLGTTPRISGDTLVVGVPCDDTDEANEVGSVYVFERSGDAWVFHQQLSASDGSVLDRFGYSVAICDDTIVVGAYTDDTSAGWDAGSVYVFIREDNKWTEIAILTAKESAAYDHFGTDVAISGDTIVVGAYSDDTSGGADAGSAYVFQPDGNGDVVWDYGSVDQVANLTASDGDDGDHFSDSMAISNNTVVFGARSDGAGSAYVFRADSKGGWYNGSVNQVAKLTASDGETGDQFGNSIAMFENTVAVGAFLDDGVAGSVCVFQPVGNGNDTWDDGSADQVAKLTACDSMALNGFGQSVAIYGDAIVVGAEYGNAQGSAYLFRHGENGAWDSGSVDQKSRFFATDGMAGDKFGQSVTIDGTIMIVGAVKGDANDIADTGSAYVFSLASRDCNSNGTPDECEQIACDGDANGDCVVDPLDSGYVQARFGCPVGTCDSECDAADANVDGVVDPLDAGYILARFGVCQ